MRLSRTKKVVLVGTTLLMVGFAGRAAAETTSPAGHHPRAAPAHTVPAHTVPARPVKLKTKPKTGTHTVPAPVRHFRGPAGSRMTTGTSSVALTFDDGPDPVETPRILKLLAQRHVHATFCLIGKNVQRYPAMVRQIVAGGNTLCDHTWSHSLTLGRQSTAKIRAELGRTIDAVQKAAPGAEVKYFRAPGGNFTPRLVSVAKQMGMTSLYWKVDPRDWDHPTGETDAAHRARVIHTIEKHTHAGSIILSHDFDQPDTVAAYRTLIPWLQERYQLIPMP